MVRPARIAASVGTRPRGPTSAETTTSAAHVRREGAPGPQAPPRSSGRGAGSSRARRSTAARSRQRHRLPADARAPARRPGRRRSPRREAAHPELVRKGGDQLERPATDRAGRSEHGDGFRVGSRVSACSDEVEPIIQGGHVEEQGVEPVQHAAVARNGTARVLGARASLEERLAQVADLAHGCPGAGRWRRHPGRRAAPRGAPAIAATRTRRSSCATPPRPSCRVTRVARAGAGRSPPDEVRGRLAAPRHTEGEEGHHLAARQCAEARWRARGATRSSTHPAGSGVTPGPGRSPSPPRAGARARRRRSPPARARAAAARADRQRTRARRARRGRRPATRSASIPAAANMPYSSSCAPMANRENDGRERPAPAPRRRGAMQDRDPDEERSGPAARAPGSMTRRPSRRLQAPEPARCGAGTRRPRRRGPGGEVGPEGRQDQQLQCTRPARAGSWTGGTRRSSGSGDRDPGTPAVSSAAAMLASSIELRGERAARRHARARSSHRADQPHGGRRS